MNYEVVYIFLFMVGVCLFAIVLFLKRDYEDRVKNSKALSEFSDLILPYEILNLINRFDPSIEIRIAHDAYAIPQAAFWREQPAYIIISKLFLDQMNDKVPQFENKHLLAIVAHELGHIKLERYLFWIPTLSMSGFLVSFCCLVCLLPFNFIGSLYALFSSVASLIVINLLSQHNEYCADAFAVKCALIPLNDFSSALVILQRYYDSRNLASQGFVKQSKKMLKDIIVNTHPSVERRIQRLQKSLGKTPGAGEKFL